MLSNCCAAALSKMRLPIVIVLLFLWISGCMDKPVPFDERKGGDNGELEKPNPNLIGGFIEGYWSPVESITSDSRDSSTNPSIQSQQLEIADDGRDGAALLSWTIASDAGEQFKLMNYAYVASQRAYKWSDPSHSNYIPIGISSNASEMQFAVNSSNSDGYALWSADGNLKISEFMGSMGHFMGNTATLADGHVPRFLIDSSGTPHLITQEHMTGGFGLNVFSRTGFNSWSRSAEQLHRMDMTNAINMPHGSLTTIIDGQNNIRAIWVEEQASNQRLMTAVHSSGTWSDAFAVLDTAADIHGVDLSAIHSISASGEDGNGNTHLILFQNGADKAIFTLDFNGTDWGHPMRRDDDMGGMASIVGEVSYAVYQGAHIVAWIEDHMGDLTIKSLRFVPGTGWGDVMEITKPAAGATIEHLRLVLNLAGHAAATWVETSATEVRVAISLQMPGMEWAPKESIAKYDSSTKVHVPDVAMHEDGTPWIVWAVERTSADTTTFTTNFCRRLADIRDTGNTGGTGDGHDHDHGQGGNDPGTGGTDPGTGGGTTDPNTDYASGYWGAASQPVMEHPDAAGNPSVHQQLDIVDAGTVFLSWSVVSDSGETLQVKRASADAEGNYTWTGSNVPEGINATATMTQFIPASSTLGYALWDDAGVWKVSEFMEMSTGMAHFMGTATLGEGHAARLLTDGTGAYLIAQSHMTNGFGLDVYSRTDASTWSTAVQLHRMGMDAANAMTMPHDSLTTFIDGNHHIRALWLETQADITRLMTAVYDTSANSWGEATAILDSSGDTHGIDLASIHSLSASGEHGNGNVHVALFVQTATDQAIYTMDFTDTWSHPMRRDDDMNGMASIVGEVQYAVYHSAQLLAWVEDHMDMFAIKSLLFTPANGWGAVEEVAKPATGATLANLGIALNHPGDALAYWSESDADGVRILTALRAADGAWAMKELIAAPENPIQNLAGALHEDGTPWVVWGEQSTMANGMLMLTTQLSQRNANVSDTIPAGGDTGSGGTDPGTGGTDPGTGGTDPGTGGTDPGTGGGGLDSGAVGELWATSDNISSTEILTSTQAEITMPKLQVTYGGNLFASWLIQSEPDPDTAELTQSDITVMRGVPNADGVYSWSDPASTMFNPVGYNAAATDTQFIVNPVTGDGITAWNLNEVTYTSEFMANMGHFMGNAQLPEGHATKILVDSSGQVYLLTQTHMIDGFGLSVYKRTVADQWSTTPVQLHRMDMNNAYNLVNHFLIAAVDGQDNLRAIWLEEQAGEWSLQNAIYNTADDTWSAVSEVHSHDMTLNRLVGGMASGTVDSADLQLILHQQDGMVHSIFAVAYTADGWALPIRLDEQTDTVTMVSAPSMVANPSGDALVGWVQTDSTMSASNTSGKMNMIMAKRYMPGMGWHAVEHVAHAGMMADASTVNVAMNATGDATVTWIESGAMESDIVASHYVAANAAWSQKELIAETASSDGTITAVATGLDSNNVPLVLWGVKQTDGINDILHLWRNSRLSAIADAQTGGDTGGGNTGGGNTGGGNASGSGTTDPNAGGNEIPDSVNWTTPVMTSQMMHSTANFRVYGPQVVLDDIGGTSIRTAMAHLNGGYGTSLTTIGNQIVRSEDNSTWENILIGSSLLDDLSNTALIESIRAVPTTGNLYGLIRDGEKLYLARYLPDAGWNKLEIPDVPAKISRRNLQLTTNDTGMVTIAWHQASQDCCTVDIHAKHFMSATGWQETQTITVPAESVIKPHVVDTDGKVHVAWLVANPEESVGGFNMHMATYTPMVGWSDVIDGPTGLRSGLTKTTSSGEHKVVVVTDQVNNTIDAYVINSAGGWAKYENINHKTADDGVRIGRHNDTQIVAGGADHFMAAWREYGPNGNGGSEVRYRTVMIHYMTDPGGMAMWHIEAPSLVGGMNTDNESNLNFVLDNAGNAYAVWTAVDQEANTDNVYVNQASMSNPWATMPELLAAYDMGAGNYAGHTSMAINSLGKVGIAWDQHMTTSGMAMHHVWFVESE